MQNLWFLLASDNAGGEKVAADPVIWLATTKIGREYLAYLTHEKKLVDKTDILYQITPDNIPLKDSFITWATTTKHSLIKTNKTIAVLQHFLRHQAEVVMAGGGEGARKAAMRLQLSATFFGNMLRYSVDSKLSSPDASSLEDIGSDSSGSIVAEAEKLLMENPRAKKLKKEYTGLVMESLKTVQANRKTKREDAHIMAVSEAKKPRR